MQDSTSTEQFVSIETIKDDCVIMKDGSVRAILMVSGVNFDLKSEDEQNLITLAYQGLLNRIDFPIQFVVHSRKLNIDNYLALLKERSAQEENALLNVQIKEYIQFIKTLVSVTNVMSKRFYVVIPYAGGNLEAEKLIGNLASFLPFSIGKKSKNAGNQEEMDFDSKKIQLKQRVEAVMSGLRPAEVRVARLETQDLLELYYNLYNPEKTEKKSLKIMEELQ